MKNVLKRIVSSINSLNKLPVKIIIHGIQLASILLLISTILYFINSKIYNFDYYINFITLSLAKTGVIIFAEAIIGGLVVDYFIKKV